MVSTGFLATHKSNSAFKYLESRNLTNELLSSKVRHPKEDRSKRWIILFRILTGRSFLMWPFWLLWSQINKWVQATLKQNETRTFLFLDNLTLSFCWTFLPVIIFGEYCELPTTPCLIQRVLMQYEVIFKFPPTTEDTGKNDRRKCKVRLNTGFVFCW